MGKFTMIHQYRPNFDWQELLAVLRPGGGRNEFELAMAKRMKAQHALAFAYGRSGIIAACKALGLTRAEIIVPAYTCNVVAEAVVVSGNQPVFVDIDLADFNTNVCTVKDALTRRTRAIIATHMYGYPIDIEAIRAAVGDNRVAIIEDAALLGPLNPGPGGNGLQGDITIFSFSPGKHLYAVAGGIVVTNSAELYEKLRAYRDREMHGLPWSVWAKRFARFLNGYVMLNASLFEIWNRINEAGSMQRARNALGLAQVVMPGDYATAFADFQGRVGLRQLHKFDAVLDRHRAWAEYYDRELHGIPGISLPPIITGATYALYTIRVERRDEIGFRERMQAKGIEVGTAFDYVVPYLKPYRSYAKGTYPQAERAAREVMNLPNYAGLSAAGGQYIAEETRNALREALSQPTFGG